MTGRLTILDSRVASVTDLGRTRGPQFGLPVNGALDQYSARVANILCANDEAAPLIEITAFDFAFTVDLDVLIAVTGAEMLLDVDGEPAPMWEPVPVRKGQTVRLTQMTQGMRCYVAIHGAFSVPRLLDSCAPDSVIGFGTELVPSTVLELEAGAVPASPFLGISLHNLDVDRPYFDGTAVIDVIDGPDIEDFGSTDYRLFDGHFIVSPNSNHIGLRLSGGALPERTSREEKISRGVPIGAVEVPPGDEVLILHRGRGVTAGYPVLGVVPATSLDTLGQVRPGQSVTFRKLDVDEATQNSRYWRGVLDALRDRVGVVFASLGMTEILSRPAERRPPPSPRGGPLSGVHAHDAQVHSNR